MMKKTTLAILISLFCISTLAACSTVNTTVLPPEEEYSFQNQEVLAEPDEGFTIDGVLDESEYANQNAHFAIRKDPIYAGSMTTVTYFGLKGIYMGFDVYDSVPVHCNYKRANINNSCVTMQMFFDVESNANASRYNLNILPDGRFSFEGSISAYSPYEWGDYTMTSDNTPVLGVTLQNGTINGDNCTDYTLELFIPYTAVGLESAPNVMYLAPAIRSYDSEELIASVISSVRLFEEKEEMRAQGLWNECFYSFDENGLICNDLSFDNGANGEVKELYGREYTLKDVPARFVVLPNEGYRLKEITANGKNVLDRITLKDGKIVLDLGYVDENLEIISTFEEISSANVTLNGTVTNTANYDISEMEMCLTDGAKIYDIALEENGTYSATVPMGQYVALYVFDDKVVKAETIDLSTSIEVDMNTSGKMYISDFVVNSLSAHRRIAEIGTEFRAEYFVGMETLNFNYNEIREEFFGAQVIFSTDSGASAAFQLLRWDNRIMLKNVNANVGKTFMTLSSGSTTENPLYTTDFPVEIAQELIENNGLTVAIERSGDTWNAYIRVGNNYYLMLEDVIFDNIEETNDITNIWLQAATATNENNAFVKDMQVLLYPVDEIVSADLPTIVSGGSNTQIKAVNLGEKFRMEMFVGMDALNFDYWTTGTKQKYNVRILFSIDGKVEAGAFSFIGYDNRVMLKEEKANNSVILFTLAEGSTTATPVYTTNYSAMLAQSIIANKGVTMVVERNGETWNTYVKVNDTYYLVHSGVSCGDIGTANITNILLQCGEATPTNRVYVKDLTIEENPIAITKLGYATKTDSSAYSGAAEVIASGDFGTKFRVETFIGQEQLNLTYDASASSDIWKTSIVFRGTDNTKTEFFLFRYGNRIIFREADNKFAKNLFTITESGYGQHTGATFSDAAMGLMSAEVATNNGITVAIERNGTTWTAYIKVNGNYYKVGSTELTATGIDVSVSSVELYGGLGTSSTNPSYAKNTLVIINPKDTITTTEE